MPDNAKPVKAPDELRPVRIERGWLPYAEGSALISVGETKVICAASVVAGVPPWLTGKGEGWVTAEYAMLPRSTATRRPRDSSRGRPDGRSLEIQRLIGRSLRAVVERAYLGERTIYIDCDVIVADGGTRTAAVTGAMVALADALLWMKSRKMVPGVPLKGFVAAVSAGLVGGTPTLDLCYKEDSAAEMDLNVVMTDAGEFVEVQGTAEKRPVTEKELTALIGLAKRGIERLLVVQREALGPEAVAELGLQSADSK